MKPNIPMDKQDPELLLWDRDLIGFVKACIIAGQQDKLNWEKTIVVGHTPHKSPIIHEKFLGLDCGSKQLLCVELNSMQAMMSYQENSERLVPYKLQESTKESLI